MTTCHREVFAGLCRSRGRSVADAMPCVVAQDGDRWTVDPTHPSYPKPVGLGDRVASGLAAVGITKERVQAVLGSCRCDENREWLNDLGRKFGIGATEG